VTEARECILFLHGDTLTLNVGSLKRTNYRGSQDVIVLSRPYKAPEPDPRMFYALGGMSDPLDLDDAPVFRGAAMGHPGAGAMRSLAIDRGETLESLVDRSADVDLSRGTFSRGSLSVPVSAAVGAPRARHAQKKGKTRAPEASRRESAEESEDADMGGSMFDGDDDVPPSRGAGVVVQSASLGASMMLPSAAESRSRSFAPRASAASASVFAASAAPKALVDHRVIMDSTAGTVVAGREVHE
jgi:hypothetical protein